ncbi:MAG: HlyD family efflux transporter periplasmic adaptor subunit [Pirellulaceae bacterium]
MSANNGTRQWARRQWLGGGLMAAVGLPLVAWSQSTGLSLAQDEPRSVNSGESTSRGNQASLPRTQAAGDPTRDPRGIVVESATVFPDQEVLVPTPVTGRIAQIYVQQNNMIAEQTLIARIDDSKAQIAVRLAQARLEAATLEAADNSAVKEAEATLALATANYERAQELHRENIKTDVDLEVAELEKTQAELKLANRQKQYELAQKRLQVSELEVEDAQQQVDLHRVIAPASGNVVEIIKHEGEWVSDGDPLIKLVNMEWLRVEGTLDNTLFNREEIYMRRVIVEHERARGEIERFDGVITWEGLREVAGKYIPVRATIRNRTNDDHWILHPGARVRMVVLDEYGTLAELESTVR